MTKLATFIVDKRNLFFLFTIIALIFSAFSRNWVQVESDLAAYLPEDSQTRQALDIMEEQFTTYGSAQIMVANLSQDQAEELKDQIASVKGVQGVEYGNTTDHYNNASALYAVTFDYDEADEECLTSLAAIESALSSYDIYVSTELGNAEQEAIDSEVSVIMVYVAVIIVLVLLFTSQTYAEVPVLILTFVAAMIMNLGTNFLLGKISFVSNSVTSILQLALSLDYAVIFCNRYKEEHQTLPIREAVIVALSKAIPEIGASSLTTIGGLVAMMFMQFRIGADMAICLIKSILFAALAFADKTGDDAIHIQTQEDLRALAENCRLDTWSQGKTVVLDKDIALDEDAAEFLPIPTFGGTFEGGGHTISGLSLTGEDSDAGLFDTLQESALVRRLTVAGQVTPGGAADTIGGIAGTNYGRLVDCSFEGAVKGDDSVGGIVGINETTGQLINCRFQGTVTGEHYVGGIAGLARATIRNCYVKCSLSGNDYVGGVAGASEENTVVSGCYSLVEIAEDGRYTGAVCGTETGEFTGNFYVSDTLAGLGRISYAGKAKPITFETLVQTDGIPDRMTRFTLRFLAEGEEIKSYEFSYGASFGQEVFPEIPVKDGYYAAWDADDLSDLHFDKTVTAEYVRYVTTLASDASRASGRSVFLLDGDFDDEATLTVTQAEEPELVDGKVAVEQWHLACSDASQQSYTVRYLTPEETAEGYDVFVRAEDGWQKADCSEFGSYLVFTVAAAEADVAILPAAGISLALALGCATAVLVLLIVLVVLCRRRAKGRKRPAPAQAAQVPPVEPRPARKKKRWVPVLLVVLAVAALCAVVGVKLAAVVGACGLLEEFASRTESVMTLTMDLQLDDSLTTTEMEITHTQVEGQAVTCIQNSGISLYYANGAVIMENGRAFQVSDLHPDYSLLPQQAAKLFGALSFSTSRSDGNVTCRLTAEGDNARQLLEVLLPEQADYFSDTQKLTVELTASKDELMSLTFFSEGTMADDAKTSYTLSGELRPESTGDELAIPDAVKQTVLSGSIEGEAPLSEDLFRLLSAWTAMSRQDSFSADVQLGVDCGPISLGENLKYGQALVEGSQIGCVRKNDLSVYFSGGVFCDQNATVLTEQDEPLADRVRLLETLKQVCLNGEYDCTDTGNGSWLYTLTLDEAAMEAVAYAAAPEMEALPVTLSSGSVQVIVSSSAIREISFSCTGGLEELEEVAPVTVSAKLTFASDGEFDIPTAVADRLTQERMEGNGQ